MIKSSNIYRILGVFIALIQASSANSGEYLLESDVDARAEINDNLFLTDAPHDVTKGIIITPSVFGIIKEQNWEAKLGAKIRSHNYSDDTLDTNDQYFDLIGIYNAERNVFSLNVNYDYDSNLSSTSTDFGISGRRVNRKMQSLTPQYTRLLSERLMLVASYTYTDVDYLEAENTGYTPYITQSGMISLVYNLTEKDRLNFSLQGVDYNSKNDLITYELFTSRIGVNHEFSETFSTDFSIGVSRQNTTNLSTQTFDFFGEPITQTQEIDYENRTLVLDAKFTQLLETGQIDGGISRNNVTNSFGGLDEVTQFTMNYNKRLSSLWRYLITGRFRDVTSISTGSRTTDRDMLFLESVVYYSIAREWNVSASYRYIARKFKSDTSDDRAPHSNRIYVGLIYNFPSLSTF